MSSVRIIQEHDLMGSNHLGCSEILTIQEVLSSRHGGMSTGKMTKGDKIMVQKLGAPGVLLLGCQVQSYSQRDRGRRKWLENGCVVEYDNAEWGELN